MEVLFGQVSMAVGSTDQVKVRVQVVVNPQLVIEKVNTWLRLQPSFSTIPGEQVIPETLPHSLVAVIAPPKGVV